MNSERLSYLKDLAVVLTVEDVQTLVALKGLGERIDPQERWYADVNEDDS